MNIKRAKSAGFCFGVKRAVDRVYELINEEKNIYTYGPIIHNEEVVKDLEGRGVHVINTVEDLKNIKDGCIVIRSHGVPRSVQEQIKLQGLECVDATCPFVKKIHNIVETQSAKGDHIVIIGNANHPEVEGIKGWCSSQVTIIESVKEAELVRFEQGEKIYIVSQTTFNYKKFQELVEILCKKGYDTNVANTICNATEERQLEAASIAETADAMIVIGGTHSSNTRKLYEICSEKCENTFYIQTLDDLHMELPSDASDVGITAGASTPNNIIEEVQNYVRINF